MAGKATAVNLTPTQGSIMKLPTRHVLVSSMALAFVECFTSQIAVGGAVPITEGGIKNVGSGVAYSYYCEAEGFIPVGNARKILKAANEALAGDAALAVRRQFQISLQDRKIYSPSRDKWVNFVIDAESCADVAKAAPIIIDALIN